MLALDGPARAWEPNRLRLRLWLFSAAGRLARGGRRLRLRLAATWPWAAQFTAAITANIEVRIMPISGLSCIHCLAGSAALRPMFESMTRTKSAMKCA
jgi:hypothetical protein